MQNRNWILTLLCFVATPLYASSIGITFTDFDDTPLSEIDEGMHHAVPTGSFEIERNGAYQLYFTEQGEGNAAQDFNIEITVGRDHLENFSRNAEGYTFEATPGTYEYNMPHGGQGISVVPFQPALTAVPLPAAAWLFGSGLLGLIAATRRKVH